MIIKCSNAGFNATVMMMKKRIILVHFTNEGNKKSTINAMKAEMIIIAKLIKTVPSIALINVIIAVPVRSFCNK